MRSTQSRQKVQKQSLQEVRLTHSPQKNLMEEKPLPQIEEDILLMHHTLDIIQSIVSHLRSQARISEADQQHIELLLKEGSKLTLQEIYHLEYTNHLAYIKHLLEKKGKVGKLFAIAKEVKKEIDRIMKMFEERFADFSYLKTLEEC